MMEQEENCVLFDNMSLAPVEVPASEKYPEIPVLDLGKMSEDTDYLHPALSLRR